MSDSQSTSPSHRVKSAKPSKAAKRYPDYPLSAHPHVFRTIEAFKFSFDGVVLGSEAERDQSEQSGERRWHP